MAGDFAIRQGGWKLIFFKNGRRELYHLPSDLSETKDVTAENPEIVTRLTKLMQDYLDRGRSTPGTVQSNEMPNGWRQVLQADRPSKTAPAAQPGAKKKRAKSRVPNVNPQ
jgi:hypothetical protein